MRILEIELDDYKVLQKNKLKIKKRQVFPKWSQIIGLIGPNGSWKTTFCSAIAKTFQSIFTRSHLGFNVKIKFEVNGSTRLIQCVDENIELFDGNESFYSFQLGTKFRKDQKEAHRSIVNHFWMGKIILSTFETNEDYPKEKPYNFKGDDPLVKYDLAGLYDLKAHGYPSITNWVIRFLENGGKQDIANIFLEQMGFQLTWTVDLKIVRNITEYAMVPNYEDRFALSKDFEESRHYSIQRVKEAKRTKLEWELYEKIQRDPRLDMTSENQILSFSETRSICNDYSEYIWKYIFLNGLRLTKGDADFGFNDLSSGEKFLIMRYLSVLSWVEPNSIIIAEEPENHLNPKWRELIIPALHKAASAYDSVLLFTTHDYRIIRYLHNNCVLKVSQWVIHNVKDQTLLCDEFDFESVGEPVIPFVYDDLKKIYRESTRKEKAELLNSMCNVPEKMQLRGSFLKDYQFFEG